MSDELKLGLIFIIYTGLLYALLYHANKPEIRRQARRYAPTPHLNRCAEHSKGLKRGQIALVNNANCDLCQSKRP